MRRRKPDESENDPKEGDVGTLRRQELGDLIVFEACERRPRFAYVKCRYRYPQRGADKAKSCAYHRGALSPWRYFFVLTA
jgi:hypothetical protein